jgi:hypothetical protein
MSKLLALLALISCHPNSKSFDYMVTLENGTYVCDEYWGGQLKDCEHVLTGTKVKSIFPAKTVSIFKVDENTK